MYWVARTDKKPYFCMGHLLVLLLLWCGELMPCPVTSLQQGSGYCHCLPLLQETGVVEKQLGHLINLLLWAGGLAAPLPCPVWPPACNESMRESPSQCCHLLLCQVILIDSSSMVFTAFSFLPCNGHATSKWGRAFDLPACLPALKHLINIGLGNWCICSCKCNDQMGRTGKLYCMVLCHVSFGVTQKNLWQKRIIFKNKAPFHIPKVSSALQGILHL